jgi:hypothetical protein
VPINTHAIRVLVGQLDELVPREDASVAVTSDAPNACSLLGNRTGYLRLGIELMKTGLADAPPTAAGGNSVESGLAYLLDSQSPAALGPLLRRPEDSRAEDDRQAKFQATFRKLFLIAAALLGVVAAIGIVGVAIWVTS